MNPKYFKTELHDFLKDPSLPQYTFAAVSTIREIECDTLCHIPITLYTFIKLNVADNSRILFITQHGNGDLIKSEVSMRNKKEIKDFVKFFISLLSDKILLPDCQMRCYYGNLDDITTFLSRTLHEEWNLISVIEDNTEKLNRYNAILLFKIFDRLNPLYIGQTIFYKFINEYLPLIYQHYDIIDEYDDKVVDEVRLKTDLLTKLRFDFELNITPKTQAR